MAKLFAVTIFVIAIASAYPIMANSWFTAAPQDISTHGYLIDDQMTDTMIEAGIAFLLSQIILAYFIWTFSDRPKGAKSVTSPAARRQWWLPDFSWSGLKCWRWASSGQGVGEQSTFTPPSADATADSSRRPDSLPFTSAIPGPDGKLGTHASRTRSTKAARIFSDSIPRTIRSRRTTS